MPGAVRGLQPLLSIVAAQENCLESFKNVDAWLPDPRYFNLIALESGLDVGILQVLQVPQRCSQGGGALVLGVSFGIRSAWLPSQHLPGDD